MICMVCHRVTPTRGALRLGGQLSNCRSGTYCCSRLISAGICNGVKVVQSVVKSAATDIEISGRTLETVGRKHSESWSIWLLKADLLAREGCYAEAASAATQAIELSGGNTMTYHVRGAIQGLAGEPLAGLDDLNRAIRSDPMLADAYVARAIIWPARSGRRQNTSFRSHRHRLRFPGKIASRHFCRPLKAQQRSFYCSTRPYPCSTIKHCFVQHMPLLSVLALLLGGLLHVRGGRRLPCGQPPSEAIDDPRICRISGQITPLMGILLMIVEFLGPSA